MSHVLVAALRQAITCSEVSYWIRLFVYVSNCMGYRNFENEAAFKRVRLLRPGKGNVIFIYSNVCSIVTEILM
jgi:hypothetical protein